MREGRRAYDISASAKPTIGMMNGLAFGGAAVLSSSLDMRVGCEDTKFRFLAAAYGRINSTWSLGAQVGWPIAKELLFTARVVEAEEAYRIGLLNHLVPREKLRDKTMEIARMIAGNHRGAVMGVKALLLQQKGENLEQQYEIETRLHHACDARRQGRGRIPRVHRAQGKGADLMAIKYEKRDGVAYITLNNPAKANIFDKETSDEISAAWIDMWEDRDIRCAILTGAATGISAAATIWRRARTSPRRSANTCARSASSGRSPARCTGRRPASTAASAITIRACGSR